MATFKWHNHVWKHGPAFVSDRAVLLVLVDLMNDDGCVRRSIEYIAGRAGVSRRTCFTRLKALERDEWLAIDSGGGRHRVSAYRVNLAKLMAEENGAETVQHLHRKNSAETVQRASETVQDLQETVQHPHPFPSYPSIPSSQRVVTDAETMPGLLVAIPDDDDASEKELIRVALHGIVGTTVLARSRSWHRDVLAALARGWSASELNAHLHERMSRNGGIDPGLARTIVRDDEPPKRKPAAIPHCGQCAPNRWLEDDDGNPIGKCPRCHPDMARATA